VFDALSDLYYEYWGEFFHFALFEPGDLDTVPVEPDRT